MAACRSPAEIFRSIHGKNPLWIAKALWIFSRFSSCWRPPSTSLFIFVLGLVAFSFSTVGGLLLAKVMNLFLKENINPLIGSAGVSAVPMAARVSQVVARVGDKHSFILMHAMGPNVADVIGTALAAGLF
jgi:Na+-transporting methylmalonyl-CoA/oxaloacetate decarboxylase beta subunit